MDIVEVLARAICCPDGKCVQEEVNDALQCSNPCRAKDRYGTKARAALAAIEAAGMVVVPSETLPNLHENGVEDDTTALQAVVEGKPYVDETK